MEGGIIPLRVYFYLRLQARFNQKRVLTSVSMLIYCLTADEVTTSFDVSGQKDSKKQKISFTFGLYFKIILAACLSVRKMTTANCLFFSDRGN